MQRHAGEIWWTRNGGWSEFVRKKFAAISGTVFGRGSSAIIRRSAGAAITSRRRNRTGGDQLRFAALARDVAAVRERQSAADFRLFRGRRSPAAADRRR